MLISCKRKCGVQYNLIFPFLCSYSDLASVDVTPSVVVTARQLPQAPFACVWCLRNIAVLGSVVHRVLVPPHIGLMSKGFSAGFHIEVTPDDLPTVLVHNMRFQLLLCRVPITLALVMGAQVHLRRVILGSCGRPFDFWTVALVREISIRSLKDWSIRHSRKMHSKRWLTLMKKASPKSCSKRRQQATSFAEPERRVDP